MEQQDQQKRLFLTIALCMAVLVGYQFFFGPKPQPGQPDGGTEVAAAPANPPTNSNGPPQPGTPAGTTPPEAAKPEQPGQAPQAKVEQAPVKTETFTSPAQHLVFSSKGGALAEAVIKGGGVQPEYKFERRTHKGEDKSGGAEGLAVDVVKIRPGQPLPGSSEISGDLHLGYDTVYSAERGNDAITFRGAGDGVSLEKTYVLNPDGYESRLEYKVTNTSGAPKKATLSIIYPAWIDPTHEQKGGFFSPPPEVSQVSCRHETSTENLQHQKESTTKAFTGPVRFISFDERYFLGAVFPRFTDGTSCVLKVDPDGARSATLLVDLGTIAPGQTVSKSFGMYLGPKSLGELTRVSEENARGGGMVSLKDSQTPPPNSGGSGAGFDPQLQHAIDFGWWAVICTVMLRILKLFQHIVVNWGLAIVLLTVVIKLALYPLTKKSMESMEAMKKLQPKMDELRKKYENDKEKLNMEIMRLYSEAKVNPFGGCLPMLLQTPIWIALYRTLLTSFELYREPLFPVWITDLTAADPFYILPLAMGGTMFITQKMQPQVGGDPAQAKMMLYFMPIFFTFIMLNLPAGLTLYIFTNNLLSIAQQKWLQRQMRLRAAAG